MRQLGRAIEVGLLCWPHKLNSLSHDIRLLLSIRRNASSVDIGRLLLEVRKKLPFPQLLSLLDALWNLFALNRLYDELLEATLLLGFTVALLRDLTGAPAADSR